MSLPRPSSPPPPRTAIARRLLLALAALAACSGEPAYKRHEAKIERVSAMQLDLLKSVEAEKSAVIATTDEESQAFATASRKASAAVEAARHELHALVDADGRAGEVEKLKTFDQAWRALEAIDAKLLALAVANTNLKASRLANGACAATLDQVVDALTDAEKAITDPNALRELSGASVAALRIQALLAPHIASPSDDEMSKLEQQIQALSNVVDKALADSRPKAPPTVQLRVGQAWAAWARYQHDVADVIRLSRQNTNVYSFEISAHEKRKATVEAQNALAALLVELQAEPRPSR